MTYRPDTPNLDYLIEALIAYRDSGQEDIIFGITREGDTENFPFTLADRAYTWLMNWRGKPWVMVKRDIVPDRIIETVLNLQPPKPAPVFANRQELIAHFRARVSQVGD